MALRLDDLFQAQFKEGGRTPAALDCQGLFLEVMRRFGHNVRETDVASYATVAVYAAIMGQLTTAKWEPLPDPEPGCAVVVALDSDAPALVDHLGVYLGDNRFIHILRSRGVLVSRVDDRFFKGKIRGYYRWIG